MENAVAPIGAALLGFSDKVRGLTGWRRAGAAFIAGVCGALAMAPFYVLPLLAVSFTVLVLLIDVAHEGERPRWRAFASGWWFGFGYFLAGVYWMAFSFFVQADQFAWMAPFAVTAMPAGLALFTGAAAFISVCFWRAGWPRVVLFASVFSILEYLRGHVLTGLPWNLAGQALAGSAIGAQTAAWYGVYGLSLVTIGVAAAPAAGLGRGATPARSILFCLAPLIGAAFLFGVGAARLAFVEPASDQARADVRIVQPNVNQRDKIDPSKWAENFRRSLVLSTDAAPSDDPLLVIWPENAAPLIDEADTALAVLSNELPTNASLIAGAVRREIGADNRYRYYNAIAVVEERGGARQAVSFYDKHHLVPFGEYLPFYGLLNAVGLAQLTPYGDAGFAAGAGPAVLASQGVSYAPLICYEAIFPGRVYPENERPRLIVTVTNDAWFGDTSGPRQHLDQARLRSIETGLPMARSANTGISALIDGKGRMIERIPLYSAGKIDAALPPSLPPPLYDQVGDWLFFLMAAAAAATGAWGHILSRAVRRRLQPLRDKI